jgi:hypothetical protein
MIIRKAPYRLIAAGRNQFRLGRISDSTMAKFRSNGWREVASWSYQPTDDAVQRAGAHDLQEQLV